MPRDEDDINYELVIREKRQDVSTVKAILQQLFSSIGLVFLCVVVAIFGKKTVIFIYIGSFLRINAKAVFQ